MESWQAPGLPRLPGRGLPLRLFDTATREVRPLAPGASARMYVCGITPYDAAHLGHALTYVTFDVVHRVLRDAGHEVAYIQNVTDVDDPLLERAVRDGVDWRQLADREIGRFRHDMSALRLLPPTAYVGAVESIPVIVETIETLRGRGATYSIDGDLYFSIASAPRFGEVSHLSHTEMVTAAADNGGDPDRPGKKDAVDPLLWRAERPGEPAWDSPFGRGRPGWHVECAAIALDRLGPVIDVQGGGSDLVFPHHECTAAHAEVATGRWPFARAFVHVGMLRLDGHKMSKSRGNLVFISELWARGADSTAVRLALLARHYREAWEWSDEALRDAEDRIARWRAAVHRPAGPDPVPVLEQVRRQLADDLDTPGALATLDRWAWDAATVGGRAAGAPVAVGEAVDALLGIRL